MKSKNIALTDLVKNLGYENPRKLSNQIRDILKEKEDFKERYIVDERDSDLYRPEKMIVSRNAETLVDNLIILSEFSGLFPRGAKGKHTAYKTLLGGVDDKSFEAKVIKHNNVIRNEINRSEKCLKKLPHFYNAITSVKALDITKCSLRKLMKEQSKSSEVLDLTDAFELSAWNEIIEFKRRIEDGEADSTLYQQMGEKFFELGESKQAMEALDMSTDIDPKNGISWAIKSLIYQSKLIENNNSHYQSLALTEFSGEILNPITAEEYWINERVDDTLNDLVDVKRVFVKAAINALTHWPAWKMPHTYGDAEGKPNFYRTLNQDFNTDIEIKREYLFRRLLAEINVVEFGQHESDITDIVRSFQMWSKNIHSSSDIVNGGTPRDKENFFKALSWISKEETKYLMDNYFKDCLKNPYKAKDNQELLRSPVVKTLYINLMGRTEYKNLLDKLLKLDLRHQQLQNINNVTSDHFYDVDSKLTAIKKKFNVEYNYFDSIPESLQKHTELSDKDISSGLLAALSETEGWTEYLKEEAWLKSPYSFDIGWEFYNLMILAMLLELVFEKNVSRNLNYLKELTVNENIMRCALSRLPTEFYCALVERINVDDMDTNNKSELLSINESILDLRQKIDMEDIQDDFM